MERQDQSDQPIDWGFDLFEAATRAGVTFAEEATPTDRFVDANGLRFHYLEWGAPEATPIVMLHGFAQTAHTWDFLALYLSGRYRVIALDQRGHGDSDWAPDGSYTLDDHQADFKAIVTALELSDTVFIGLSMGGRNAYVYAADNPGDVKALVIVDSAPVHERAGADTVRRFVSGSDEMDSVEEFVERVRRYSPRRSKDSIRGSLKHNLKRLRNGKWTWKYDKVLRERGSGPPPDPDVLWGYIDNVQCPALFVRGAGSSIVSEETALETVRRLPHGRLATVPNSGHLVPGDNPAYLQSILAQFLDPLVIG